MDSPRESPLKLDKRDLTQPMKADREFRRIWRLAVLGCILMAVGGILVPYLDIYLPNASNGSGFVVGGYVPPRGGGNLPSTQTAPQTSYGNVTLRGPGCKGAKYYGFHFAFSSDGTLTLAPNPGFNSLPFAVQNLDTSGQVQVGNLVIHTFTATFVLVYNGTTLTISVGNPNNPVSNPVVASVPYELIVNCNQAGYGTNASVNNFIAQVGSTSIATCTPNVGNQRYATVTSPPIPVTLVIDCQAGSVNIRFPGIVYSNPGVFVQCSIQPPVPLIYMANAAAVHAPVSIQAQEYPRIDIGTDQTSRIMQAIEQYSFGPTYGYILQSPNTVYTQDGSMPPVLHSINYQYDNSSVSLAYEPNPLVQDAIIANRDTIAYCQDSSGNPTGYSLTGTPSHIICFSTNIHSPVFNSCSGWGLYEWQLQVTNPESFINSSKERVVNLNIQMLPVCSAYLMPLTVYQDKALGDIPVFRTVQVGNSSYGYLAGSCSRAWDYARFSQAGPFGVISTTFANVCYEVLNAQAQTGTPGVSGDQTFCNSGSAQKSNIAGQLSPVDVVNQQPIETFNSAGSFFSFLFGNNLIFVKFRDPSNIYACQVLDCQVVQFQNGSTTQNIPINYPFYKEIIPGIPDTGKWLVTRATLWVLRYKVTGYFTGVDLTSDNECSAFGAQYFDDGNDGWCYAQVAPSNGGQGGSVVSNMQTLCGQLLSSIAVAASPNNVLCSTNSHDITVYKIEPIPRPPVGKMYIQPPASLYCPATPGTVQLFVDGGLGYGATVDNGNITFNSYPTYPEFSGQDVLNSTKELSSLDQLLTNNPDVLTKQMTNQVALTVLRDLNKDVSSLYHIMDCKNTLNALATQRSTTNSAKYVNEDNDAIPVLVAPPTFPYVLYIPNYQALLDAYQTYLDSLTVLQNTISDAINTISNGSTPSTSSGSDFYSVTAQSIQNAFQGLVTSYVQYISALESYISATRNIPNTSSIYPPNLENLIAACSGIGSPGTGNNMIPPACYQAETDQSLLYQILISSSGSGTPTITTALTTNPPNPSAPVPNYSDCVAITVTRKVFGQFSSIPQSIYSCQTMPAGP